MSMKFEFFYLNTGMSGSDSFDVRSGQKYGPSGSSGPTRMNINCGGAVLCAAQTLEPCILIQYFHRTFFVIGVNKYLNELCGAG